MVIEMISNHSSQRNRQPRPTLIVGLGGTGHRIAVNLKSLVWQSWPIGQIENRVRFLVFDTAQEELVINRNGRTVKLEPGNEFFDIGQTPIEKIKRNLAQQPAIEARLGGTINSLSPTVLRNGAKQLRPLGLLAFLWRYTEIEEQLRGAIWSLAGRQTEQQDSQEGINVFIANSLVGGTGSSTFLDTAYVVRELFDELGTLADFCYITGVGVLPRAFHGINGPNLVPNAVASLKELNHCMMRGSFKVRYPNGRIITTAQPPFNMYYLVDGVDERGHTWHGPNEVCRLAAEAIFLQMGSQVGQKHENDFDNLDDVLIRQTEDGDGTFFGSFGLASLVFPGPSIARACAARQAQQLIQHGLLVQPQSALTDSKPVNQLVEDFLNSANLASVSLAEQLACDDQGLPLTVELGVPGWVNRLAKQAIPGELIRYVNDYDQARLSTDFRRWLSQNESQLTAAGINFLLVQLTRLVHQAGLRVAEAWLIELSSRLEKIAGQLNTGQVERESQQMALSQELGHLELAFLQAGESGFLGRGRRIAQAQHTYLTTAQNLFEIRWEMQVTASSLKVLHQIIRQVQDQLAACRAATNRLLAVQRNLAVTAIDYADGFSLEGVTSRSLVSESLLEMLFAHYAPPINDSLATLFNQTKSPLDWHNIAPAQIEAEILTACQPAFGELVAMNVEQVVALQTDNVPPESYYTWLMEQATPSWNLDRTRLPDGGAALQQVAVLGVPDEDNSLYQRHAKTLVSTADPTRITAFVARIGAAYTAIQQWDSYLAIYDQARGQLPLHILPQFQSDNTRARQTFALGTLFGFIKNQGAYFYYTPVDRLDKPIKLGQGIANSLQTFAGRDSLVQETRERVEQIVASRGIEAVLRNLSQYYEANSNNGRFPADDLVLELKRLVRAYADELRQINQFTPTQIWPGGDELATLNQAGGE